MITIKPPLGEMPVWVGDIVKGYIFLIDNTWYMKVSGDGPTVWNVLNLSTGVLFVFDNKVRVDKVMRRAVLDLSVAQDI